MIFIIAFIISTLSLAQFGAAMQKSNTSKTGKSNFFTQNLSPSIVGEPKIATDQILLRPDSTPGKEPLESGSGLDLFTYGVEKRGSTGSRIFEPAQEDFIRGSPIEKLSLQVNDLCSDSLDSLLGISEPLVDRSILKTLEAIPSTSNVSKIFETQVAGHFSDENTELTVVHNVTTEIFSVKAFKSYDYKAFVAELMILEGFQSAKKELKSLTFEFTGCLFDSRNYYIITGPLGNFKPLSDRATHAKLVSLQGEDLKNFYLRVSSLLKTFHGTGIAHGSISPNNMFISEDLKDLKISNFTRSVNLIAASTFSHGLSLGFSYAFAQPINNHDLLNKDIVSLIRLFMVYDDSLLKGAMKTSGMMGVALLRHEIKVYQLFLETMYSYSSDSACALQGIISNVCKPNEKLLAIEERNVDHAGADDSIWGVFTNFCCGRSNNNLADRRNRLPGCNSLQNFYFEVLESDRLGRNLDLGIIIARLTKLDKSLFNPSLSHISKLLPKDRFNVLGKQKKRRATGLLVRNNSNTTINLDDEQGEWVLI